MSLNKIPPPSSVLSRSGIPESFVSGELHLGFWGFVKKIVGAFDSFFVLRTLSAYQYGVYQLFLSFYAAASDFFHDAFAVVIQNELYRFSGEGRESEAKKLFFEYALFRILLASIPSVVVWYFADRLAIGYGYGPSATNWLKALAWLFLVDTGIILFSVLLKMRLQFSLLASRPTFQKFFQFLLLGSLYFLGHLNLDSVFWVIVLAPLSTLVYLTPAVLRAMRPWISIEMHPYSVLYPVVRGYGRWELPQLFVRDLVAKVRPWVIKTFIDTEAVGYYGIASTAVGLLRDLIPAKTLSTLLPRLVHDKKYVQYLYVRGTKIYVLLALLVSSFGALVYPLAIYLLFPVYSPSIPLFYVLLITIPVFAFSKFLGDLLVAEQRQKALFLYSLSGNFFTIAFMFIFAPLFSVLGVGFAEALGQLLTAAFRYFYLTKTGFVKKISLVDFFSIDEEDRRFFWRGVAVLKSVAFRG